MSTNFPQKRFPDVYKNFFARCFLVTSVPRTFAWCGDWLPQGGGVRITQKLPWRTYVGFEVAPKGELKLGSYSAFFPSQKKFIDYHIKEPWQSRLLAAVKIYLQEHAGEHFSGFTIHVLTEGPTQRASGSVPALTAALAGALSLISKKITLAQIQQWQHLPVSELLQNNSAHFDTVFQLAWRLSNIFEFPFVRSGGAPFTSLSYGDTPQVYVLTKTLKELGWHREESGAVKIPESEIVPYRAWDIRELLPVPAEGWPLGWSFLFSGRVTEVGGAVRLRILGVNEKIQEIEAGIKVFSETEFGNILQKMVSSIVEEEGYVKMNALLTFRILLRFLDLLHYGDESNRLDRFFRDYQQYVDWAKIMYSYPSNLKRLERQAEHIADILEMPCIVKPPFQAAGEFLVVTPASTHQEFMRRLVKAAHKEGMPVELDYSSTLQGIENDGLRVDQWLEQGIYSSFISSHAKVLRTRDRHGQEERLVLSPEEFAKRKKSFDVLIDPKETKIYVRGRALTSREIHSAKKTIEILQILDAHFGKEVPASALSPSSYVDRNEMQSKIIAPLINIVKQRTKKRFPIAIHGRIGTDFTLKLSTGEAKLWWLEASSHS